MKKSILRIVVVASLAFIVACSNSDKNKVISSTGTVTFFHYVTGSSTLSLESVSNSRGLGTVDFESFGPGISLTVKNWDLTVTDIREESDASDDVPVLEDATFSVTRNRRSIHALIGDYDLDTVELVNLTVAHDDDDGDFGDDNDDGVIDDKAQYINFSHIHSGLGSLDIYLVEPAQAGTDLSLLTPTATIDFKESSASVRLDENVTKYYLRIAAHSAPTIEIYNSGEKTLKDYFDQTIIIAPYIGAVNTGSQITAFYYGDAKSQKWLAANSQGQVRVYNALQDSTGLDFILDSSGIPPINIDSSLLFKGLSSYQLVDTSAITYFVSPDDPLFPGFFDGIGPTIDVQDGQSWTVIFFGHVAGFGTSAALKVLEDDRRFSTKATFTFSNVAYIDDVTLRLPINVHVKLKTAPLDGDEPKFKLLAYGNHGTTTLNADNSYEIWVTSQDELNLIAGPEPFDVEGGENFHFVLLENNAGGSPFQIVQLIGEADAERTTITSASASATAGGPGVAITVQAKDRGANNLAVGGDTVTLTATGSVTGAASLLFTDNGNGTYTATLTDATAETMTVTGTINGDAIVDSAVVTFVAP